MSNNPIPLLVVAASITGFTVPTTNTFAQVVSIAPSYSISDVEPVVNLEGVPTVPTDAWQLIQKQAADNALRLLTPSVTSAGNVVPATSSNDARQSSVQPAAESSVVVRAQSQSEPLRQPLPLPTNQVPGPLSSALPGPLPQPAPPRTVPAKPVPPQPLPPTAEANPTQPPAVSLGTPSATDPASKATKEEPRSYLPPQKPIGQISIDVRAKSERGNNTRPKDESLAVVGHIPTVQAAPATYWEAPTASLTKPTASDVPYQPLYFEEVNLERYGRSYGLVQPAVSAVRFYGTVPLLPYAMANHPPCELNYWRWPYPAGWMAPPVREYEPFNPKAAAIEASAVTGMFFLVP